MQTSIKHNSLIRFITLTSMMTLSSMAFAVEYTPGNLALLDSADQWQMNRLFEPTQRQVQKENSGKIVIYDGLRDITVAKALNENFNRIENMMFTRVVITDELGQPQVDNTGNVLVEDDGC